MAEHKNDVNLDGVKHLDTMVRENPALGKMTVKVQSTWERGTKAVVTVGPVQALGQNLFPRTRRFVITSDDPAPLGGVDSAPFPPELLARRALRLRDDRHRDQRRPLRRPARRDGHRHGGGHRRPRDAGSRQVRPQRHHATSATR